MELVRVHGKDYRKIAENLKSKCRKQINYKLRKLKENPEQMYEEFGDLLDVLNKPNEFGRPINDRNDII